MDEETKAEPGEGEMEQVGAYQLQEQVPQDEYSRGELYRATHETSGAAALVFRPPEDEKGSEPLTSNESRPWRRLGLALSGTAVLMVLLLPAKLAPVVARGVQGEAASEEVWATDVHVDPVPVRSGEAPRPRKNQKSAPCTEGLEVEVSGACWLPIEKRPCPPQTVAHQGQCLLPVAAPRPPVTSLDGGGGPEPR